MRRQPGHATRRDAASQCVWKRGRSAKSTFADLLYLAHSPLRLDDRELLILGVQASDLFPLGLVTEGGKFLIRDVAVFVLEVVAENHPVVLVELNGMGRPYKVTVWQDDLLHERLVFGASPHIRLSIHNPVNP